MRVSAHDIPGVTSVDRACHCYSVREFRHTFSDPPVSRANCTLLVFWPGTMVPQINLCELEHELSRKLTQVAVTKRVQLKFSDRRVTVAVEMKEQLSQLRAATERAFRERFLIRPPALLLRNWPWYLKGPWEETTSTTWQRPAGHHSRCTSQERNPIRPRKNQLGVSHSNKKKEVGTGGFYF